jgi:hypothetical protein
MQITGLLLFCLLRILAGIADPACMSDIRARRNNGSDIDDIDTGIFYYSLVVLAPPDAALKTCQLGRKSDSWSRVCRKQNATANIYLGKWQTNFLRFTKFIFSSLLLAQETTL